MNSSRFGSLFALAAAAVLLAGCAGLPWAPTATPVPPATATATLTPSPTATATATSTPTATPSPTPTAMPTLDPYAGMTIDDLAARTYGDGEVTIERMLDQNDAFTRYLIHYPSDGLTIYGFMDVPTGEGPFPVAIVLHGYIDPDVYQTLAYTTRYADALARAGYLSIHPNLRGYPPSDSGPNEFRVGMAIDALNLIGLVHRAGGTAGPLEAADPDHIGVMGHSMGGGITIRVITARPNDVQAAVLYGSMNADERVNTARMVFWSGGNARVPESYVDEADLLRISPSTYLDRIAVPVSIHHSDDDTTVPPEWSADLAAQLESLGKSVEYFTYQGTPHTFNGAADTLFMSRMIDFFDRYVKP